MNRTRSLPLSASGVMSHVPPHAVVATFPAVSVPPNGKVSALVTPPTTQNAVFAGGDREECHRCDHQHCRHQRHVVSHVRPPRPGYDVTSGSSGVFADGLLGGALLSNEAMDGRKPRRV
jgi:hypothetical protein